jgi:hypothetical protein
VSVFAMKAAPPNPVSLNDEMADKMLVFTVASTP